MELKIFILCSSRAEPGNVTVHSIHSNIGQNAFQITCGDGILPRMSRDFAIFMAKHLAEYYLPVNNYNSSSICTSIWIFWRIA